MKRVLWLALALLPPSEAAAGVGHFSSVAIGTDGLALIAYTAGTNLKVAHCSNVACTSATLSTLDTSGGTQPAVAIGGDGLGLIAYVTAAGIKVAHCANLECTSAATTLVYTGSLGAGASPDLAVGPDGLGLVVFVHNRSGLICSLYAVHCLNAACGTSATSIIESTLSNFISPGLMTMASDGLPLVAYARDFYIPHGVARYIFLAGCQDAGCVAHSPAPTLLVDSSAEPLDIALGADGLPLLAWSEYVPGSSTLRMAHCSDTSCGSATRSILDFATAFIQGGAVDRGADGLGLAAYVLGDDLKMAHCSNPDCTSATLTVLDSAAQVTGNGLAIGADGLGLVSYNDIVGGDLKVAHCENVACTSATTTIVDDGAAAVDLFVELSHSPEPVPGLQDLTYRIQSHNRGSDVVTEIRITQQLDSELVFRSASGTGWSCTQAGGTVTCVRPDATGFTLPDVTVVVQAPPTAYVPYSMVRISSPGVDDLSPNDNTAYDYATVTAAPLAELAVAMSDGGAVVHPGQPFSWTITASNVGATTVAGATVSDTFPATVTGVVWTCVPAGGATCPAGGTGDISASVSLPVGGMATFTAMGTLSPAAYVLSNTASIAPPSGSYDPNPGDNTATVSSQPEATQAYTVTPCRVVDTRLAPPALQANTTRTFAVAGTCGIPADARAVMVNATAVNPGDRGNLRLYPAGAAAPLASSLNFAPGRTRANNAVVPLGADGQISVQCDMLPGSTATSHFVLDVYGYFK